MEQSAAIGRDAAFGSEIGAIAQQAEKGAEAEFVEAGGGFGVGARVGGTVHHPADQAARAGERVPIAIRRHVERQEPARLRIENEQDAVEVVQRAAVQVFEQGTAAGGAGEERRERFLVDGMSECALQQAFHGSGYLRSEDTADFLLVLASETDHFIEQGGRGMPGSAAEQAPEQPPGIARAGNVGGQIQQAEGEVRGDEPLAAAHDTQFVCVEQDSPGETFLLQHTDQTVCGGETAVQSLGREVERGFGGDSQHPGGGFLAAAQEERLTAVLFAERGLDGFRIAEPPPKEFGQRVEQDTARDTRLPAAAQFAVSVAQQARDGTPTALGAGCIEARGELRLLRQDLVEIVFAEGVALDLEDIHGLVAPLDERCRHAEQDTQGLDQRRFEVGAAVQNPALEFDAFTVLVEAAAQSRGKRGSVTEQTGLLGLARVVAENGLAGGNVPAVDFGFLNVTFKAAERLQFLFPVGGAAAGLGFRNRSGLLPPGAEEFLETAGRDVAREGDARCPPRHPHLPTHQFSYDKRINV